FALPAAAPSSISSSDMAQPATSGKAVLPKFPASPEVPFGVNEVRLNARQWLVAFLVLLTVILCVPRLWTRIERFDTGPDYRIPYDLSKDYWLYSRRMRQVSARDKIIVLGDSVIWGEYVAPDGTLSHFLNREA